MTTYIKRDLHFHSLKTPVLTTSTVDVLGCWSTYPGRLQMLSKLIHCGIGDSHIPEHTF